METALLIILGLLAGWLSILLYLRIQRERKETIAIKKAGLADFSGRLREAAGQADLAEVSRRLCGLLRDTCKCSPMVFLRRRDGGLEVGFSQGTLKLTAGSWRLPAAADLVAHLRRHPYPGLSAALWRYLPRSLGEALRGAGCHFHFPLLAGQNLYGLCFFSSSPVLRSSSFDLLLSSMAYTLSAAQRVRQAREENGLLMDQVKTLAADSRRLSGTLPTARGLLKLIKHRDSETLVGHIIDEVARDLDLKSCLFLYTPGSEDGSIRIVQRGLKREITPPSREAFDYLMSRLAPDKLEPVTSLPAEGQPAASLTSDIHRAGLKYVAEFPLSTVRSGVLAFESDRDPVMVIARLRGHGLSATELMANAESFEEIKALSYTDGLTGLANRRYFKRRLDEEIGRASRYGRSMGLIIFDLDELKGINDRYGHQAGDSIIQQMGEVLKRSVRSIDVVARYGGDEFCIIMPESDRAICRRFMLRLHQKVATTRFRVSQLETELAYTISQGGAVYPDDGASSEQLVYAADMALLRAKESGRDRFVLSE